MVQLTTRSKDLVGKKVIDKNSTVVGEVVDVVINNKQKVLKALLVDQKNKDSKSALPYEKIQEIIEDSIFINNKDVLQQEKKVVEGDDTFSGTKVLIDGNEVGKLTDFYYEVKTGEIKEIEVSLKNNGASEKKRISIHNVKKLHSDKIELKDEKNSKKDKAQSKSTSSGPSIMSSNNSSTNGSDYNDIGEKIKNKVKNVFD